MHQEEEPYSRQTTQDDVVNLNVGGKQMATLRQTLCVVKGSHLERMFNGEREHNHIIDKQGNIFLDFSPKYFTLILDSLRAVRLSDDMSLEEITDLCKRDKKFNVLVEYLGLFGVASTCPIEGYFLQAGETVGITEGGTVLTKIGVNGHEGIFGSPSYDTGVVTWTLLIPQYSKWMFVGVISNNAKICSKSYALPTAYGWSSAGLFRGGHKLGSFTTFHKGRCVLKMDCHTRTLSITQGERPSKFMRLPPNGKWCLHINLRYKNDSVALTEVSIQ